MAPTVQANALIRVRPVCYANNQVAINVLDYRVTAVVGPMTTQQLADALSTVFAPLYGNWLHIEATYRGLYLQMEQGATLFSQMISMVGQGATGIPGNEPLPQQCCGLIRKLTDFGGPEFRGRFYAPFPYKAADSAHGKLGIAQRTTLMTMATQFFTPTAYFIGGNEADLLPVLRHENTAIPPTAIIGTNVSYNIATQRRRGDYGKPNPAPF